MAGCVIAAGGWRPLAGIRRFWQIDSRKYAKTLARDTGPVDARADGAWPVPLTLRYAQPPWRPATSADSRSGARCIRR